MLEKKILGNKNVLRKGFQCINVSMGPNFVLLPLVIAFLNRKELQISRMTVSTPVVSFFFIYKHSPRLP